MAKDKKWSDEDLRIAESLYMDFMTATDIAKETGIPRTTIAYYIKEYWKLKRAMAKTEIMKAMTAGKKSSFVALTNNALKIMNRALASSATGKTPPTLKEALDAAKVLDTIDKITRLDETAEKDSLDATDQVNSKQLIERLKEADPFFELDEKESNNEDKSVN